MGSFAIWHNHYIVAKFPIYTERKCNNMKTSKHSAAVKAEIIVVGLCGLIICALWYPFSISLSTMGVVGIAPTLENNVQMWTQLAFYWFVSIPCFVILAVAWKISDAIKKGEAFSCRVAELIKKCAKILLWDVVLFLIGNLVFVFLGWNYYALIYFIVAAVGIVIVSFLSVLSHYVKNAAVLKEEVDGTI